MRGCEEQSRLRECSIPHWPRRMKLRFAAAYVSESESKFLVGVRNGKWPPRRRDGGNTYWCIEDLDAALDRLKNDIETDSAVAVAEDDGWDDVIGKS